MDKDYTIFLPPGLQFDPTDEELVGYFLYCKVWNLPCEPSIIPELDFCSTDPWELNGKAFSSQNQFYFFSRMMENRATSKGHWEEIDVEDKTLLTSCGKKVGIKKYLVFYIDEVPRKTKSNWLMEEYHLCKSDLLSQHYCKRGRNQPPDLKEWVLCRVYDSKTDSRGVDYFQRDDDHPEVELSMMDEMFLSMEDDQDEISFPN